LRVSNLRRRKLYKEEEKPRRECKGEIYVEETEEKGGEEDTFRRAVRGAAINHLIKINTIGGDPADQYMKKKKEDTFSERGGIKEEASCL